jgi:hypothetical protein
MSRFSLENNLILIAIWAITIAGNKFAMECNLSELSNFISKSSYRAIHILLSPKSFLIFLDSLVSELHLSKVVFIEDRVVRNSKKVRRGKNPPLSVVLGL